MRSPRLLLLLLLLLWVQIAAAVTIEGIVLRDDTGAPLVSAEVRLVRAGERYSTAELETGRDGRFRVEDLPEGRYTLTIAKPGYLDTTLGLPATASLPTPLTVRLVRTASIAGRVQWRDGRPIENAQVYLMERAKSGNLQRPRIAGAYFNSKSDGSFRLYALPPGNYVLAMSHQSGGQSGGILFPETSRPRLFALKGGEEIRDCDFIADAESSFPISGKVEAPSLAEQPSTNQTAAPAKPPSMYSVGIAPASQPGILIAWTQADATGSFKLPPVPWGEYLLFGAGPVMGYSGMGSVPARDGDLVFGSDRIQVSGTVENIRLALAPARTTALRLDASKSGTAGCPGSLEVRFSAVEAWGTELTRTVTLPFGELRSLSNLAPARYEISMARPDENCGLASAAVLDLREGSRSEPFVLTAGGKGSISGQIADPRGETPLEVVLIPLGSASTTQIAVQPVSADGRFRFPDLPPRRYGLSVRVNTKEGATPMISDFASLVEVEVLGGEVEIVLNAPSPPERASTP